jgi:hypothetical protein
MLRLGDALADTFGQLELPTIAIASTINYKLHLLHSNNNKQ